MPHGTCRAIGNIFKRATLSSFRTFASPRPVATSTFSATAGRRPTSAWKCWRRQADLRAEEVARLERETARGRNPNARPDIETAR
jgi:hypothetical protein